MAVKIGSLIIQLALEHGLLKSGLTEAEKQVKKTTRSIEQAGQGLVDFGQKMAVAVTLPMAALAKGAVNGFIEQKKAMADVNAALASMGNASGKTAAELSKTADQLEMRSLFDAELILKKVTAQLLTFGNISGQQFDRAQQAAVDLAQRLDGDLQAAAIMLGKALNNPIKGVTALQKAGVELSTSQKALVKSFIEAGNMAAAQGIVLAEVERQSRGAAQAAADATPWRAAQVAIAQAMDAIGEAVLPMVTAVADGVTRMAQEFNKLSPEMKQTIILGAGLAAAIGPVVIVAGSLIQSTAGITAAFVTMAGGGATAIGALRNVALAATGLGAVVAALGLNFQQTTALIAGAVTGYGVYRGALAVAALATQAMASQVALQAAAVVSSTRVVGGLTAAKFALSGAIGTVAGGFRALTAVMIANPFTAVAAAVGVLAGAMITLGQNQRSAREETNNLITSLKALAAAQSEQFKGERALLAGRLAVAEGTPANSGPLDRLLPKWLQDANAGARTAEIISLRKALKDADQAYADAGKAAEAIAVPIAQAGAAAEGAGGKLKRNAADTKAAADAFQRLYDRLNPYQAAERQLDADRMLIRSQKDLTEARKEELLAALDQERFRNRTAGRGPAKVSDWLTKDEPLVDFGKQLDEVQDRLGAAARKTRVHTVQIAESFRDMAERSTRALRGMVDAIKGGDWLDILTSAVDMFLQLASSGVFGKTLAGRVNAPRIPGNANGTAYHPGGLMKVGERGPEILQVPRGGRVVPNHELREAGAMRIAITMDESTGALGAFVRNAAGEIVATAAPAIARNGAQMALTRLSTAQGQSLA